MMASIGRNVLNEKTKLWKLAAKADHRIKPILLGKADLEQYAASILGHEIRAHGILVAQA